MCSNNEDFIRVFLLLDETCQIPEINNKPEIETTIVTTLPQIITTIITTIPEVITTIVTTMPVIITTIVTTTPIIETTIIRTTIPENIPETTIIHISTTLPEPEIISTIRNIQPTIIITQLEKYETTEIHTEKLCSEKGKIYSGRECICDENSGYYSINSEYARNKCYKKNEMPKNVYYDNITKTYKICFQTCATCLKGGSYNENNCLTCSSNYVKEPENNSSNCVDNCKNFYYYDSLNKYTCTEDEQCPNEAGLIIRNKYKCISNCIDDDIYQYQYNGECLSSCPINTEPNEMNICQINNIATCSTTDFDLNLDETIKQENVQLVAKNYAKEFYYTVNHISKFISQNFTMILYKNSSCIDELNLNITKIEYDSCIKQLKIDNNIDEDRELIIAVIDIVNEDKPITSFGFFHPDTGEKLDAAKSCSDKDVIMYEKILSVLNEPLSLKLLTEQKINIFDLNDDFYNDICFHFESPNGKDATLQDRIKTFYPNITLCDINCGKMNINFTTLEAECHCTFQDLLSKNIFQNDIFGNNVLIKEALEEVMEVLNNLNVEVLTCYKDVFDFNYFKKNIGGFIILFLFINETGACLFYYLKSKSEILRYIFSLTEVFLLTKFQKKSEIDENKDISNPPIKKLKRNQSYRNNNINVNSSKNVINNCIIISPKNRKPPSKKDLNVNIRE